MTETRTDQIESWHAHIYFDAGSRETAARLYERTRERFAEAEIGRFHERPVGPHPMWSYQIAFVPDRFAEIVSWLVLNRAGLDVFVHPNTGDALTDHRDRAVWIGRSHHLALSALA